MNDLVDLNALSAAIMGVGSQISTAVNVGKVQQQLDEISKPNQLINWYFPRPVNQRGVSGIVTAKGYFIDRWKLVDGQVELTDDGLVLKGTIQQILEYPLNHSFTVSVLTAAGTLLPSDHVEYNDANRTFQITANGETLVAAKLELGQYQTLTTDQDGYQILQDPVPNMGTTLRLCQRYYADIFRSIARRGNSDTSFRYFQITYPESMRVTPTATLVSGTIHVSTGAKMENGADYTSVDFSNRTNNTCYARFRGISSTGVYCAVDIRVQLDAEL